VSLGHHRLRPEVTKRGHRFAPSAPRAIAASDTPNPHTKNPRTNISPGVGSHRNLFWASSRCINTLSISRMSKGWVQSSSNLGQRLGCSRVAASRRCRGNPFPLVLDERCSIFLNMGEPVLAWDPAPETSETPPSFLFRSMKARLPRDYSSNSPECPSGIIL
jgi:hypothetical protein